MSDLSGRVLFSIFGPPQGGALCWAVRIISIAVSIFIACILAAWAASYGLDEGMGGYRLSTSVYRCSTSGSSLSCSLRSPGDTTFLVGWRCCSTRQ